MRQRPSCAGLWICFCRRMTISKEMTSIGSDSCELMGCSLYTSHSPRGARCCTQRSDWNDTEFSRCCCAWSRCPNMSGSRSSFLYCKTAFCMLHLQVRGRLGDLLFIEMNRSSFLHRLLKMSRRTCARQEIAPLPSSSVTRKVVIGRYVLCLF